jgi:hypothetical protein
MRVLETDHFSLLLPAEWVAEQEDEVVLISDRDGVGCLEISVLLSDGADFDAAAVASLAENPDCLSPMAVAGLDGFGCEFREEGAAVREWFLPCGRRLFYLTYSCDEENAGLDDAAVDELLSTLAVSREQPALP